MFERLAWYLKFDAKNDSFKKSTEYHIVIKHAAVTLMEAEKKKLTLIGNNAVNAMWLKIEKELQEYYLTSTLKNAFSAHIHAMSQIPKKVSCFVRVVFD